MAMTSLRWGAGTRPPLMSGGGIVVIGLVAILAYQVLVPLLLIVWTSLKTIRPGEPGFLELSFTLANYARVYGISEFWEASLNTLYFAFLSSFCAFLFGNLLAWAVDRNNTTLVNVI